MNPRFLTVLKRKYCRREHLEYTDWYSKHFKRLKSSKRFCLVTKEVNKTYRISYWLAFGQRRNEQLFLKKATLFKLNYSNLYEHFMTRLQDSCIWSTLSLLRQSPSPGCWRAAGSSWSKALTFFFSSLILFDLRFGLVLLSPRHGLAPLLVLLSPLTLNKIL